MRAAGREVRHGVHARVPVRVTRRLPRIRRPGAPRPRVRRVRRASGRSRSTCTCRMPRAPGPSCSSCTAAAGASAGAGSSRRSCREAQSFGRITAAGFAVVAADYRLSGEATFPAQVRRRRAALAWIGEHADEHGLDASRVVLWGGSAGGTLAALVGLQGHPSVRGVVDWYGPSDLFEMARFTAGRDAPGESREDQWLGAPVASVPDAAAAASPALQVRRGCTAVPPRARRRRHRRAAGAERGCSRRRCAPAASRSSSTSSRVPATSGAARATRPPTRSSIARSRSRAASSPEATAPRTPARCLVWLPRAL